MTARDGGDAIGRQLARRLCDDLDAGFADVVRAYQRVVYSTLLRSCRNPADAEDLAAEAFLRAYRALRTYDRERIAGLRLRPWLVTIALNSWRNLARDQARRPRQVPLEGRPEQPSDDDDHQRLVDRMASAEELAGMINELPEQQRLAVVLRHVSGLSVAETAEVLGRPEGTVKSLVSRGLGRLRERCADHPVPGGPGTSPGVGGAGHRKRGAR